MLLNLPPHRRPGNSRKDRRTLLNPPPRRRPGNNHKGRRMLLNPPHHRRPDNNRKGRRMLLNPPHHRRLDNNRKGRKERIPVILQGQNYLPVVEPEVKPATMLGTPLRCNNNWTT